MIEKKERLLPVLMGGADVLCLLLLFYEDDYGCDDAHGDASTDCRSGDRKARLDLLIRENGSCFAGFGDLHLRRTVGVQGFKVCGGVTDADPTVLLSVIIVDVCPKMTIIFCIDI